jgi:hypothetical protein
MGRTCIDLPSWHAMCELAQAARLENLRDTKGDASAAEAALRLIRSRHG